MGIDCSTREPWWFTGTRGWLRCVRDICEAPGEFGRGGRLALKIELAKKRPECVYAIHADIMSALEAEAAQQAAKGASG